METGTVLLAALIVYFAILEALTVVSLIRNRKELLRKAFSHETMPTGDPVRALAGGSDVGRFVVWLVCGSVGCVLGSFILALLTVLLLGYRL